MNLNTDIDIDLKQFFLWWGRELSYCLPEGVRKALNDNSGYVFLSIEGETVQFQQQRQGQLQNIATLALTDEASAEKYQQILKQNSELENSHFVLRLTAEQGIKKILYLPAAAKENLQQVIGFEMDRQTPFSPEQVYFSAKILGKEQQGKIKVQLVITPKDILDGLYHQLKKANIQPTVADYCAAKNDFEQDLNPYNLLPEQDRPIKSRATQITMWGLALLAAVLFMAILAYPSWQQQQEIDSLRMQLKSLKSDTQLVQSYQLEIDQIVDETEQLITIKNQAASMTEAVELLSKLLPQDTWLTHFKYSNERFQIQGQSPTASALISLVEATSLFSNARFVSPLTQDKRTGLERFQISMEINSKEEVEGE